MINYRRLKNIIDANTLRSVLGLCYAYMGSNTERKLYKVALNELASNKIRTYDGYVCTNNFYISTNGNRSTDSKYYLVTFGKADEAVFSFLYHHEMGKNPEIFPL